MSTETPAPAPVASAATPSKQEGRGSQGRGRGNQGRGGRGRGGGRGAAQGRGPGGDGGVSLAPTTGIPYGHVPGYLPGSSSLVEELDHRVLIVLRDGRHLVGILRSFDQFSNMVLEEASERKIHRGSDGVTYFSDVPLGVYVVRGDSMVLLGQVSSDEGMKEVELSELDEIIEKSGTPSLEWDFDKDLLA